MRIHSTDIRVFAPFILIHLFLLLFSSVNIIILVVLHTLSACVCCTLSRISLDHLIHGEEDNNLQRKLFQVCFEVDYHSGLVTKYNKAFRDLISVLGISESEVSRLHLDLRKVLNNGHDFLEHLQKHFSSLGPYNQDEVPLWCKISYCDQNSSMVNGQKLEKIHTIVGTVTKIPSEYHRCNHNTQRLSFVLQSQTFWSQNIPNCALSMEMRMANNNTLSDLEVPEIEEIQGTEKKLTTIIAGFHHEVKNPITCIQGLLELYQQETSQERKNQSIAQICHCVEYVMGLLDRFLSFAKMQAGTFSLEYNPFNPKKVVDCIGSVIRLLAEQKNITLDIHIEEPLSIPDVVLGDRTRILQILTNLMINALKYTPEGGLIQFKLSSDKEKIHERSGEVFLPLTYSVKDSGVGMKQEDVYKLFKPYTLIEGNESRTSSGLGLFISKELATKMGGDILVNTELHKGTEFVFKLDAKVLSHDDEMRHSKELQSLQYVSPNDSHNDAFPINVYQSCTRLYPEKKLLVVEDNLINMKFLCDLVRKYGIDVDTADSAMSALSKVERGCYDFVLMDLCLENGTITDGMSCARMIRSYIGKTPSKKQPVICGLSASGGDNHIKDLCIQAGMNALMEKPLRASDVQKILQL